jgi:hypothetical protein
MRRLSLLLSALVLLGCGGSDSEPLGLGPTDTNVAGSYALTSSNGRPLPVVAFVTSDEEWDMTSDTFVIAGDNTWNETTNYLVTSLSTGSTRTTSSQSVGTYSIANAQINFTITQGKQTFSGSVTGSYLSVLFNGGHFIYQK